jgi:hypothetical protein
MISLFNSVGFYFLMPLAFSLGLTLLFFSIPGDLYFDLFILPLFIFLLVISVKIIFPRKLFVSSGFKLIFLQKRHRSIIFLYLFVVLMSGPLDIYLNGFKLLDPLTYADFNGVGRYVRHISILCWTLVPIAYIFIESKKHKYFLIIYALIFPILIIDRNRLFASFYSLVFCLVLVPHFAKFPNLLSELRLKRKRIFFLLSVLILAFSGLGSFRSGLEVFSVESSGNVLSEGMLPLRDIYYYLSPLMQQIILYITTPIFNFATILAVDFKNEDFLLSQLSPFNRELFDAYPYAPVMIARFNVGTEFFPWLLYGGFSLVILSLVFMMISFLLSGFLLRIFPNIFTLLIFLRISYLVLFMGFAPQFYILLNLGFVILMFLLWGLSSILSKIGEPMPVDRR